MWVEGRWSSLTFELHLISFCNVGNVLAFAQFVSISASFRSINPVPGVPCSGFSSCTLPVMPAASSKPVDSCKFCRKQFGVDPNPTVKNPGPNDVLTRRAPGSKECKTCFGFLRNGESRFSQLTRTALLEALKDSAEQSNYDSALNHWCEARQDGKRRRGGLWLWSG